MDAQLYKEFKIIEKRFGQRYVKTIFVLVIIPTAL